MDDFLYTGHLTEHKVAFSYGVFTHVTNEAVVAHDCDPVAAHILGRAMAACGLLTPQLSAKEDRINTVWKYREGLRSVVVDAGADGTMRGLVSPRHLDGLGESISELYGDKGTVNVVRTRESNILTSGTTEASLQDVVADLELALCISDQVESGMCVMIGFQADPEHPVALCQGLLIQALPEANPGVFETFRKRMATPEVRELLAHRLDMDNNFELVVRAFTNDPAPAFRVDECPTPRWSCTCSEEKMSAVLKTLPPSDREDILASGETLNIRCEFCNKLYEIDPATSRSIWANDT